MSIALGLWIFYRRVLSASIIFSMFLALLGIGNVPFFMGAGFAFVFLTPMFHYLLYEVNSPGEYYFYYNIGLSRLLLWLSTIAISIVLGLSIMFI